MKLARTIRFDESDLNVFEHPAEPDEWAISGGFAFSNWTEEMITGKARAEAMVLRIAHAFEQATDWHRKTPDFDWV